MVIVDSHVRHTALTMIDFAAATAFTVIIPLAVGFFTYRKLPEAGRHIFWLTVAWFTAELFSYVARMRGYSNWIIYLLLSFVEIALVARFFRRIIGNVSVRTFISWMTWIGLFLVAIEYILSNSPDNTVTMLFECLFFFSMGLYFLYENILTKRASEYMVITVCLMALFLASSVYYTMWRFIKGDKELFVIFGNAHGMLLVACYIVFAYGLWRLQLR